MLSSTISSISLPLRAPAASRRLTTARADPKGNLPPKEYPPSPVTSIKKWSSDQSVKDRPKPNSETVNPLEMSRTYRRTVFDLDDWKRHRESSRYFRHMVTLPEVRAWVLLGTRATLPGRETFGDSRRCLSSLAYPTAATYLFF